MTIPPKKVVNANAGDADHVGGNDWDDLSDYLNNVDKTGPVKINTRTYFRSGKREDRNPADTFSLIHIIPAIVANRNINWPLLTADGKPVIDTFLNVFTVDQQFNAGIIGGGYLQLTNDETITLVGTQNNLTIAATSTTIRLNPASTLTLTGIIGGVDGRIIFLDNVSTVNVILSDDDALSTAGNRILLDVNQTLLPNQSCALKYDVTSSRWRLWASAIDTSAAGAPSTATYVTLTTDATLSQERTLTAGDGLSLTDGGTGNAVTLAKDTIDTGRKRVQFIDDFFGDSGSTGSLGGGTNFQVSVSGTGAIINNNSIAETGVFGLWEPTTGTTSTGRAGIFSGATGSLALGQGVATLEGKFKITTLSTSGERYQLRWGFYDSTSNAPVDAVSFLYDESTSASWRIQTMSNSVATTTTTATTVDITAFHRFKIVVNALGTSVSFFIDGTEVSGSPITTNIPTGVTRTLTIMTGIYKSVGSTARLYNIDYIAFDYDLTTPR